MTKANGIAMIQELLFTCEQEDGISAEDDKQLSAIEEELGVKPASLDPGSNWGTLILDATCLPDDIPYPVDLRLLAESRETTEKVIDELFKQLQGKIPRKSRHNCVKARTYSWSSSQRKSQAVRRSGTRSASSSTRSAAT